MHVTNADALHRARCWPHPSLRLLPGGRPAAVLSAPCRTATVRAAPVCIVTVGTAQGPGAATLAVTLPTLLLLLEVVDLLSDFAALQRGEVAGPAMLEEAAPVRTGRAAAEGTDVLEVASRPLADAEQPREAVLLAS